MSEHGKKNPATSTNLLNLYLGGPGMGVGGIALPFGHEMSPFLFGEGRTSKSYKEEMCNKHTNSIIAMV